MWWITTTPPRGLSSRGTAWYASISSPPSPEMVIVSARIASLMRGSLGTCRFRIFGRHMNPGGVHTAPAATRSGLHGPLRIERSHRSPGHRVLLERRHEHAVLGEHAPIAVDPAGGRLGGLVPDQQPPGDIEPVDEVHRVWDHAGGDRGVRVLDAHPVAVGAHGEPDDAAAGRPGEHGLIGRLRRERSLEAVPRHLYGHAPLLVDPGDRPQLCARER